MYIPRTEGGAVIGDYAYAYLADMQRPSISRRMRYSTVTYDRLSTLLGQWNVRFVVFNDRDEVRPFDAKLREYLELSGGAVFEYERVHVYRVDPDRSAPTTSKSSTSPTEREPTAPGQ